MPSKQLMGFWWFFNFTLLAAGAVSIALSVVWGRPDLLMNLTLNTMDLKLGLVLGILFLVTWVISIAAVIQKNHVTAGLIFLNVILVIDMLYVLFLGSLIWVYTLHELNNFHQVYSEQTPATRIAVQDMFKCCGYFNNADLVEIGGTFCATPTLASQTTSLCWSPITSHADITLNPIFSTIYGFMGILGCLFFTSICVINERKKEERFKLIDAKRGGRGFV